ncbi:hypothetical protein [Vibrio cholerae]|nr:hypothetical protein [Vibrio cholerae]
MKQQCIWRCKFRVIASLGCGVCAR